MSIRWSTGLLRVWVTLSVLWVAKVAWDGYSDWNDPRLEGVFGKSPPAEINAVLWPVVGHFALLAVWPPMTILVIGLVVRWVLRVLQSSPRPPS